MMKVGGLILELVFLDKFMLSLSEHTKMVLCTDLPVYCFLYKLILSFCLCFLFYGH